jgi:hypothetical protein
MRFACSLLRMLALFASASLLGAPLLLADDLPNDTTTIVRLSPAQAEKLVAERPGVTCDVVFEGHNKRIQRQGLPLSGLKSLDAPTAKALAAFDKGFMWLDGLETLSAETAEALAGFSGCLFLNGVKRLDRDTAKALADLQGNGLSLCGVAALDPETAAQVARFEGEELVLGITVLDAPTAERLAEFKGQVLDLPKLTKLDAKAAKALAKFKGAVLDVPRLADADEETRDALSTRAGQPAVRLIEMNQPAVEPLPNKAMQRTRDKIGPDGKPKVASR